MAVTLSAAGGARAVDRRAAAVDREAGRAQQVRLQRIGHVLVQMDQPPAVHTLEVQVRVAVTGVHGLIGRAATALGREAAHGTLLDQAVKRTGDRAAAGSFVAHGREQLLDRELLVRVRRQKRQQRTALLRVITVSHGFASKSGMNPEFKP